MISIIVLLVCQLYISFIPFTWITRMDVRYRAGHACPVVVYGYGYPVTYTYTLYTIISYWALLKYVVSLSVSLSVCLLYFKTDIQSSAWQSGDSHFA